jgi:hypothetical protein
MGLKQRGMGLVGAFLAMVVAVFAALLVMKVAPPWIEYLSLRKVLGVMATSGDLKVDTEQQVRLAFERRAEIDNVHVIRARDLKLTRAGDQYVAEFSYQSVVPLFGNVSVVFDFAGNAGRPSLLALRRNE